MVIDAEKVNELSFDLKKIYEDIDSIKLNVDLYGIIVDEKLEEMEV